MGWHSMKCRCQLRAWVITPSKTLVTPRLEITHCASSCLPDTQALPEEKTGRDTYPLWAAADFFLCVFQCHSIFIYII